MYKQNRTVECGYENGCGNLTSNIKCQLVGIYHNDTRSASCCRQIVDASRKTNANEWYTKAKKCKQ